MKRIISFACALLLMLCLFTGAYASGSSPLPDVEASVFGVVGGFTYEGSKLVYLNDERLSAGSCFGVGKPGEDASVFITSRSCVTASDSYGNIIGEYEHVYLLKGKADIYERDTLIKCEVVWIGPADSGEDIAIIKANEPVKGAKALYLMPKGTAAGDAVYSVGSDSAKAYTEADALFEANVSETAFYGTVIGFSTVNGTKTVLSTAKVNGLNVGGPLADSEGNVIGVNSLAYTEPENYAAIDISHVIEALDENGLGYTDASSLAAKLYNYRVYLLAAAVLLAVIIVLLVVLLKKGSGNHSRMSVTMLYNEPLSAEPYTKSLDKSLVIGRASDADIAFPDDTKGVSRKHCRIDRCGDTAVITDMNSKFGTYLNGKKLDPDMAVVLNNGDIIELGSKAVAFVFKIS